jgi:hypothetical protein
VRRLLVLTALLVTSVALPARATAASKGGAVIVAGPVTVRAYRMYLIASPASKKSRADLTVLFERRSRGEVQEHYYGFSRGVSVKLAANGSSARLLASLGAYGHIDLRFAPGPSSIRSKRWRRRPQTSASRQTSPQRRRVDLDRF